MTNDDTLREAVESACLAYDEIDGDRSCPGAMWAAMRTAAPILARDYERRIAALEAALAKNVEALCEGFCDGSPECPIFDDCSGCAPRAALAGSAGK